MWAFIGERLATFSLGRGLGNVNGCGPGGDYRADLLTEVSPPPLIRLIFPSVPYATKVLSLCLARSHTRACARVTQSRILNSRGASFIVNNFFSAQRRRT
jgi:hypothetical protein